MTTKFYFHKGQRAVSTDAQDERDFHTEFQAALIRWITDAQMDGGVIADADGKRAQYRSEKAEDIGAVLGHGLYDFLHAYAELCCKFRGYKADVRETRSLSAGVIQPNEECVIAMGESREYVEFPPEKP